MDRFAGRDQQQRGRRRRAAARAASSARQTSRAVADGDTPLTLPGRWRDEHEIAGDESDWRSARPGSARSTRSSEGAPAAGTGVPGSARHAKPDVTGLDPAPRRGDAAARAEQMPVTRADCSGNEPTRCCGGAGRVHTLIIASSDQPIAFPSASSHSESSDHRRPRFRLAIHPVDCAPAARTLGLRGDPAVRYAARQDPRAAAGRHHPVGRTQERVRRRRAALRHRRLRRRACRCSASATACS